MAKRRKRRVRMQPRFFLILFIALASVIIVLLFVITSYSIHYTKLYDKKARKRAVFLYRCNLFTSLRFRCFCALLRMRFLRVTLEEKTTRNRGTEHTGF